MADNVLEEILNYTDLPGMGGEELVVYQPLVLTPVESNPNNRTPDLEADYSAVRQNFHYQQQMLFDAAKIFLENAKNSDSPRHMEVFATLMGQMTNTSKELLKLHKEMREITSETTTAGKSANNTQLNINEASFFVGGPADLMDKIGDAFETHNNDIQVVDEQ